MSENTTVASPSPTSDAEAASVPTPSRAHRLTLGGVLDFRHLGLAAVLLILAVIGTATTDTFLTESNLLNILTSASVIGVVSVGMTFVIIGGGIDLSVGAIVALASVWCTITSVQNHGLWPMIGVALLVGALTGLVNGVLIAYAGMVPFIATLAMLASARGLAERISNRQSQIVNVPSFANIAADKVFGIPVLVLIFAGVVAVGWLLLNRTTFGRRTFAIGGNAEAARLAGINVKRHTMLLYILAGIACGIAAFMLAARTNTGASTHGTLYELDAIAAVIIGGTSLMGGRGTLVGTILGVLIFTTITNLFVLNNLTTDAQEIAKGAIIVVAVLLQSRTGRARRNE